MALICRPWRVEDAEALRPMIMDLLVINAAHGADIDPTAKNVEVLLALGRKFSTVGDPTLVACDDDELVAFTIWGEFVTAPLEMRPPRLCTGVATYVAPGWRGKGISKEIRTEAMQVARARGYGRVKGATFYNIAEKSMQAVGFRVVATELEVVL